MTRFRRLVAGLCLIGTTGLCYTALRAANEPEPAVPQDQVAQLLSRMEKLEARITVLEADKEHATRQANAVFDTAPSTSALSQPTGTGQPRGPGNVAPPARDADSDWPPVRIRLLKATSPSAK